MESMRRLKCFKLNEVNEYDHFDMAICLSCKNVFWIICYVLCMLWKVKILSVFLFRIERNKLLMFQDTFMLEWPIKMDSNNHLTLKSITKMLQPRIVAIILCATQTYDGRSVAVENANAMSHRQFIFECKGSLSNVLLFRSSSNTLISLLIGYI